MHITNYPRKNIIILWNHFLWITAIPPHIYKQISSFKFYSSFNLSWIFIVHLNHCYTILWSHLFMEVRHTQRVKVNMWQNTNTKLHGRAINCHHIGPYSEYVGVIPFKNVDIIALISLQYILNVIREKLIIGWWSLFTLTLRRLNVNQNRI